MNYFRVLIPSVIAILALSGCGGSSSSGGGLTSGGGGGQTNPFAGRFAGATSNSGGDKGVVYVNISSSGAITGTGVDSTAVAAAPITGSITSAGAVTITGYGGGNNSETGTVSLSNNVLSGTLTSSTGSTTTVQLSSSTLATVPKFFGALTGSYTQTGGSGPGSGNLTLLVDISGNVTGVGVNGNNKSQAITGTITSAGVVNLSTSGGGGTSFQGTLSLNGSSATGTLNGSDGSVATVTLTLS